MSDVQIGKITHYYDKIGVAVIELSKGTLKVGDSVKISGHDKEFIQTVGSLQVEHESVGKIKSGTSCGMKVDQPVRTGDVLYRVNS